MIHMQAGKVTNFFPPQAIGTSAVAGYIDTKGFNYLTVVTNLAAVTTATSATSMAFTEGATTAAADSITELTGGTATGNFTLPKGSGTDSTGTVTAFQIDLKKRKRYLKLSAALSHSSVFTGTAYLSRAAKAPTTDAGAGADDVVIV